MWHKTGNMTNSSHGSLPGIDTSLLAAYGVDDALLKVWLEAFPRLLPIQARAVAEFNLFSGQNLLIFAPTSSGKTFVGEMAAVAAARRNRRAFYLLPLKSLAEEKFEQFHERYGDLGLKIAVSSRDRKEHDRAIERGDFDIAIVVFEKMDSLLVSKPTLLADIGVVIIDEMQMLTDESRGPRLELLLSKVLKFAKGTQIIGLSAVLEKSESIRDWIGARLLQDNMRPVELRKGVFCNGTFYYVLHNAGTEGQERFEGPASASMGHAALGLVEALVARDEQCIVFLRDKTSTIEMARLFAEHTTLAPAETALEELGDLAEASPSTDVLTALLSSGVAFHNADLGYAQRRAIENGFRRGEIRAIFSTTTLGMGINLPAKNVIIDHKRWQFSREFQQMHLVDISKGEYENLGGRAGRLSLEPDFGRSILITSSEFEEKRLRDIYIKGGFEEARPRLANMPLEDIILNLCASHVACAEQGLAEFLLRTFTGRNVWSREQTPMPSAARNRFRPRRSSAQGIGAEALRFQDLLHEALERLLADGLLTQAERGPITASELGHLVAKSCILAETGATLSEWASENRGSKLSPLETLLLVAQTKDAQSVHVPLARSEWQDDRYLHGLRDSATLEGVLERPLVAKLLEPAKRPSFEQTRAIKRALILLDWINEVPLGEIEEKFYQAWPGLVQNVGETDAWLCESLLGICRLLNWPAAALEDFSSLAKRLQFGLLDDAIPLYERIKVHCTRAVARKLVDGGITSVRKLRAASFERIAELIGHRTAQKLASALHLKLPKPGTKGAAPSAKRPRTTVSGDQMRRAGAHDLIIDTRNLSVTFRDVEITLTRKCFNLLLVLARRAPNFVHKQVIYEALWGQTHPDSYPYEKQISDHKTRLKKAFMAAATSSDIISEQEINELFVNKYGVGYQLALPQENIQIIE